MQGCEFVVLGYARRPVAAFARRSVA